ncbi:MAG: hypothetical protein KC729_10155, partial [Candidatus Eisenbacteria bacterium]|nr:hypothetical protein [Candidatus Eisenbacteria bacterium]
LRGGVCSADGKTVVLDAVSDVFVIGLDGRAPVPVHPPSHVTAIAISADGSWLALAREPEPGSAIVEMVQPGLPATLTSRILGSSVRALCFAEGAP